MIDYQVWLARKRTNLSRLVAECEERSLDETILSVRNAFKSAGVYVPEGVIELEAKRQHIVSVKHVEDLKAIESNVAKTVLDQELRSEDESVSFLPPKKRKSHKQE